MYECYCSLRAPGTEEHHTEECPCHHWGNSTHQKTRRKGPHILSIKIAQKKFSWLLYPRYLGGGDGVGIFNLLVSHRNIYGPFGVAWVSIFWVFLFLHPQDPNPKWIHHIASNRAKTRSTRSQACVKYRGIIIYI